jgi:hypothetical protein
VTGGVAWRRSSEARAAVLAYCRELRSGLRTYPRTRRYLRRCAVCRLLFLVDPRNAWRKCVCCPYGCRPIRRRRRSNERVAAYYCTPAGRQKKRALNRARSLRAAPCPGVETPPPLRADDEFTPEVITHVQVVVSLFEGRRVGRDEIIALLAKILRQRQMARRRRGGYGAPQMRRKSRGG